MKKIIKFMDMILISFREVFNREKTFNWFVIVIIGLIIKSDDKGLTSIIRELDLNYKNYEPLINFFRSNAWELENLVSMWISIVKKDENVLKSIDGQYILIGDGIKVAKEGNKIPGVKKLKQESGNTKKPKFIFGHMIGVVGVLYGNMKKQFLLPLSARIQDGEDKIKEFQNPNYEKKSHVVKLVIEAINIAYKLGPSILIVDRYFMTKCVLEKLIEAKRKGIALEIITRAKINCTAYGEVTQYGGRGRPRKKGKDIKVNELFETMKDKFISYEIFLYGKVQKVEIYCTNLLWGKGLYERLRFILVKIDGKESILVSTNLNLEPYKIVVAYGYRWKIEAFFKSFIGTISGFSYRFWCKYMPKLDKYKKENNEFNLELVDEHGRKKITETLSAIEKFIMCSCIAHGILQVISIKFSDIILSSNLQWLRTKSKTNHVSEETVAFNLKKIFSCMLQKNSRISIIQIIILKQKVKNEKRQQNSA